MRTISAKVLFKVIFPAIVLMFVFSSCSSKPKIEGAFNYNPEKPKAGDEITIYYNSDSTKLAKADSVVLVAYLYSKDLDNTIGVEMNKTEKGWEGKVKTTPETRGLIIKFKHNEDVDNNSKKGYVIYLYGNDDKILPGSVAGLGGALLNWGSYYLELDRDFALGLKYVQEDFQNHPEIKDDYLEQYLSLYQQVHPDKVDSVAQSELSRLEKKDSLTEDDLTVLTEWYGKLNNKEKSDNYAKILSEKYPQSKYLQVERYKELRAEQDLNKKKEMAEQFAKDFPNSEYIEDAYDLVANLYRDKKLYKPLKDFLAANINRPSVYRFYSVAQRMYSENADLNTAIAIAKMGVDRGEKELNNPPGKKPESMTKKEWKEEREYYLGLVLYSYGDGLFLSGKKKEALPNVERAVSLTQNQEGDINELYTKLLYENGDNQKAKTVIEDFIKKGKNTAGMIGILKNVYKAENGSEDGFQAYLSTLESASMKNLKDKLAKEIISEPAPDFTLEDLNGNKVSLAGLKGKTVVVDFWATWCGPCMSSFPGMEKAVEKYSKDENVKFLFVNAWEREKDRKASVQKFLQKNNYPFHILMDYNDKVVGDYKVAGIPTKFVIDKTGKIRFVSVGFEGNTDQLVDELSTMINLVE